MALALTNQGNPGPGDGDALAATLLDLIVRGRFKTHVGEGEKAARPADRAGRRLAAARRPRDARRRDRGVGAEGRADPARRPRRPAGRPVRSQRTSNASRKSHFVSARGRLIKAERKQFRVPRADVITRVLAFLVFGIGALFVILGAVRFTDHPAWSPMTWMLVGGAVATFGFLVLTAPRSLWVSTRREALPRIARWEAFRRYLEELPRLSDESPITLGTWEKLLVYATAFGCAERVAEAARLRVGEVETGGGVGTSGALLYGPWSNSVMAVRQRAGPGVVDLALQQPRQSGVGGRDRAVVVGLRRRGRLVRRWRRRWRRRRRRRCLVGGERPGASLRQVDDRRRAIGRPAPHVLPVGVEPLLLQQRVEHPEVGRRVEPGAGDPLPVAGVRGEVAVDQVRRNQRSPRRQSISRCFTRKLAQTIRTRFGTKPSVASWRMPASTRP